MKYIQDGNIMAVRKELRDHPESINIETASGKSALALAIVRFNASNWGWMIVDEDRIRKTRLIYQEIVQYGGCIGSWCNLDIPDEVSVYMRKIRRRRLMCASSLRVLLGIKKFRKPPLLDGANRDVLLLITKMLYRESGTRVEWDEEDMAEKKKKLK
jgi:hypothetical protein